MLIKQKGQRPTVINALDLKQYMQMIEGKDRLHSLQEFAQTDRLARYQLSKQRAAGWKNTVAGQSKQKLLEKERRIQLEEEARVKLDEEFAEEENRRRQIAIERAKKVLYLDTDLVKAFHSKVNQLQAIEERDMQMALKYSRRNAGQASEQQLFETSKRMLEEALQKEQRLIDEKKQKSLETAMEQLAQQKQKLLKESHERNALIEEGHRIMEQDTLYNQQQALNEQNRRKTSLQINADLEKLKQDIHQRKLEQKQKSQEEDERIEAWVNRKQQQTQMKNELERKWFLQQMGENQQRATHDHDARIEEQIKQRVVVRDAKDKAEDEAKRLKKKKNSEELRTFFVNHLQRAQSIKKQEQEEGQKILQEYMRIREDAITQKEQARISRLAQGKLLQEAHLKHIAENQQRKREEKLKIKKEALEKEAELQKEEKELEEYMRHIAQEPWARDNYRLQSYIKDHLQKPLEAKKKDPSTSNRLGFANQGYSHVDLQGTNEIAKGPYLSTISIEFPQK
ncbi:hypothetical protein EDD86DRAFT_190728 [Gorgonomyces haynaldii]|nr:hypothetical protein EDD86DRAFT_190728 [Gorgonomyces haynaldii]